MKTTTTVMESLFTSFNTKLQDGFGRGEAAASRFLTYCMVLTSSTAMETYAWLAMLGSMRKWIGPRLADKAVKQAMIVVNDDYENTVRVNRNDIDDDKLGIYPVLFDQMGYDAKLLWPRLAVAAMVENANWLDGNAFFLASRKYGKNTIKNYVTDALTAESYAAARQTMMGYVGYDGNTLNVMPDTLIVGPALEKTAKDIVVNTKIVVSIATGDGSKTQPAVIDNMLAGTVKLVVDPLLVGAAANYWFLGACNGPVKPVAVQKRKEGALIRWDKDSDTCVKDNNENHYGLHYRGAACLTLPHLMYAGFKSA